MDIIILGLIAVVLLVNIALFLKSKSKPNDEDNKDQEVLKIKDDINSLKNSNVSVTKLARGMPIGYSPENLDDGTLLSAFKNRSKLNSSSD